MTKAEASDLVSVGALKTALTELSTRIATVNAAFITSGTNLKVVNASSAASGDLTTAMQAFQKFFLAAQKNATTAGASISTVTAVADMYLGSIEAEEALQSISYLAQDFGSKEQPKYELNQVVTPLQKVRVAVDTMISKLSAAEKKALETALARVAKAEETAEKLKAEFKASVPSILQHFGVSDESPSMILYLTLAPYNFLESVISKMTGSGEDPEKDPEPTEDPENPDADEPAGDKPTGDKKPDAKKKLLSKDNLNRTTHATANVKKIIDLQKRMAANKSELQEAKIALDRLKEDQSGDDRQSRLRTVLIDIADIKSNIAEISPKLTVLGSIFQTMSNDMKTVAAFLTDKDFVKGKAELAAANRVYKELEEALKDFSVAV